MPPQPKQILFFSDGIPFVLPAKAETRAWLNRIARKHKKQIGQLTYVFVSDEQLWKMNKDFLQHNTYTDIITFDYSEKNTVSGELYISIDRVRDNAKSFGVPVRDELHRVMAHGLLHLCGFKDKSTKEAAVMRKQEEMALALR
ncbi:MAG: rRNA maturation RNase YbeY [Bacteroidetes bacterium]|nr:rRNA maturation RNase YbeY [Bacteroidota bacterium]